MSWQDRAYHRETPDQMRLMPLRGRSVTLWIIVLNVVVFIGDRLAGRLMYGNPAAGPLFRWGYFSAERLGHGQVWRLLAFQFLHENVFHIFFNMWMFYFFGRLVESVLGPVRFLIFYLICGMAGAATYLLLLGLGTWMQTPRVPFLLIEDPATPLIGASAGIFGIMMASAALAPDMTVGLLLPPVTLKLRTLAYILLGVSVILLMVGDENAGGEAGHVGGAVAGFLLIRQIWLLDILKRRPRPSNPGQPGRWQRNQEKAFRREEAEQAAVDHILDKVRRQGLQSLSRGEKKTLQRATEKQRRGE